MTRTGLIGWRGMVGSVLLERMLEEGDFADQRLSPLFFSTSQAGQSAPDIGRELPPLADANDLDALGELDVILTCQGGDYTDSTYEALRGRGWRGYWIDASSKLRLAENALIVLDPINRPAIEGALASGVKTFAGANCTVSCLLMAVQGLVRQPGLVEWISSMTYQAASGGGSRHIRELLAGMKLLGNAADHQDPAQSILDIDRQVTSVQRSSNLPTELFGAALAGSLIPWIDSAVEGGRTREEWKAQVEANKILDTTSPLLIDGICVRVGALRCHSQALTIKLSRELALPDIEHMLAEANPWVEVIPNTAEATRARLTPAAVSGTLRVPIGRLHPLTLGPQYLGAFTVGDQLLWGAAEPLRRMLRLLLDFLHR